MNIRRFTTRRMNIFLSSLLAYVIILSLPIAIGFGIYSQALGVITDEVQRANDAILKQVQQSFDSRLLEVERIAVRIGLDARVNTLIPVRRDISVTHVYTMHEIITDFRAYLTANPFINSFYVYMKNSDIAIASNASYNSRELMDIWQGADEAEYEQWKELIHSVDNKRYVLLNRILTQDAPPSPLLAYVSPLPIGAAKNPSAVLVMYLNEATLRDIVKSIKTINGSVVMVMNSKGQILFSTEPHTLPAELTYAALSEGTGPITRTVDGRDLTYSRIRSAAADWVYVNVAPTELFMQEALNARRLAWISFTACMALGGLLVFLFIRANVNPVRELVGMLTRRSGMAMDRGINEYGFIRDVVSRIIDEKESIQRRLESQDTAMRNYHFARVLKGAADNIPFESTRQYYRLDFKTDSFAVLLFCLVGFDRELWKDGRAANEPASGVLKNSVEELAAASGHTGVMVEVDDFYACLLNMKDGEEHRDDLMRIAGEAVRFTGEHFGLRFTAAASGPTKSYSAIPILYQQALEALEHLLLLGRDRVMHHDDMGAAKGGPALPRKSFALEEQRFMNCLRAGDYDTAKHLFNDLIVSNYLSDPSIPIDLVRCRMFGLVNNMVDALVEPSFQREGRLLLGGKPVERLLNCRSVPELQQCLNDLIDEFCRLDSAREATDPGLIEKVREHIQRNHRDANLNVSMLADRFGMTTANLSKLFKKRTGMGLLDYIHRCRIERAKELLRDRRNNIRDISQLAGFIDSDAFIRVFKKYEGVTPGRYRDAITVPENNKTAQD